MPQRPAGLTGAEEDLGELAPGVRVRGIRRHCGLELRQVTVIEHTFTLATTVRD